MTIIFLRTMIIYFVVVFAVRFMGKRQIGELQPSEFVVAMLISEFAVIPIEDPNMPILTGIIPIITLLSFEVILSFIALKNCIVRDFVTGRPSIVIHNGKIDEHEMEKIRLNMDDLVKELRLKDILNISDVRYAILETNGNLSVFTRDSLSPVSKRDLDIDGDYISLPYTLVSGGKINRYNLKRLNKDEKWLRKTLSEKGISSHREVLYMSCDERGNVQIIKKEENSG